MRRWSHDEEVPKFPPQVIERAERMVLEPKDQYESQWAAIESIAAKIGCSGETLVPSGRASTSVTLASERV